MSHTHFAPTTAGEICKVANHQSHLGTCTQLVDSKQAIPTAFDSCPPACVPQRTSVITTIYASAIVTDELTPSK
jgi:hypothetical protein